jgi:hypothetical protein
MKAYPSLFLRLEINEAIDLEWLVDQAETFCKDRAMTNALRLSMNIMDGSEKKFERGMVPQIMTEALAVSFDTAVGHDYLRRLGKALRIIPSIRE